MALNKAAMGAKDPKRFCKAATSGGSPAKGGANLGAPLGKKLRLAFEMAFELQLCSCDACPGRAVRRAGPTP
jgi:hypothetical protein